MRSGDYLAAERDCREGLRTHARSVELWNELGLALNRQTRFTEAADAFRAAVRLDPSIQGLRLNLGIALFRAGRMAEAAQELEKLPDQPQARQLLALSYVALEQYGQALTILEHLAVSSTDPSVHIALASCYAALKRGADVEKAMAHMFAVVPESAALHLALGQAYSGTHESDSERALSEFRKAAAMDPNLPGAHLQAGRLLWKERRFEEAAPEFLAELKIDPAAIDAKYYLGTIHLYQNDLGRAVSYLEDFVKLRGGERNAWFELGRALVQQGEFGRAIGALEKALALGPNDASLHYQLAQAYRAAGRDPEARREFAAYRRLRALQLDRINQDLQAQRSTNK